MIKRILAITLCISLFQSITFSQSKDYKAPGRVERYVQEIFPYSFNTMLMRDACMYYLYKELIKNNARELTPNETLQKAAQEVSNYLSNKDESSFKNLPSNLQLKNRLKSIDAGIHQAYDINLSVPIGKGQLNYTYDELAQEIVFQFFKRKSIEQLLHPAYIYIGFGCTMDKAGKKVIVTATLGNYNLTTTPKKEIKESKIPISSKSFGIDAYDEKTCKSCEKFKDIQSLHGSLSIMNEEVYFSYDDFKALKRLLRSNKDGLAIDLVNRSQFSCANPTILNNQNISRGFLLKPVYADEFDKKNVETGRIANSKLKISLGKIPEGMRHFELHLIVIVDGVACKTIYPVYNRQFETTTIPKAQAFPDTVTQYNKFVYQPKVRKDTIRFVIPFKTGKATYLKEDIQAFIDSMQQPAFKPLEFTINAYTSIEGNAAKNSQLRDGRITSIVQALQQFGTSSKVTTTSNESWNLFFKDIVGTDFQFLRTKSKKEILEYLKKGDNLKRIEPILQKHRFAEIIIQVEYDISTPENEEKYVTFMFNKALKEYNTTKALAIQKYIIQQVLSKRYSLNAIEQMKIDEKPAFSGLEMNKIWLQYEANTTPIDVNFLKEMRRLFMLDMQNMYVKRNFLLARLTLETLETEAYIADMQKEIDALLISHLPKYAVDPLNLLLQTKSLNALNKTFRVQNEAEFLQAAFDRIKDVVEIDKTDWRGALNLASIFADMGEYELPISIMSGMINNPNVSEDFVFGFISLCTHTDYMQHSKAFADACNKASNMNKYKFCELISTGALTLMSMQNPAIKAIYCELCTNKQ